MTTSTELKIGNATYTVALDRSDPRLVHLLKTGEDGVEICTGCFFIEFLHMVSDALKEMRP